MALFQGRGSTRRDSHIQLQLLGRPDMADLTVGELQGAREIFIAAGFTAVKFLVFDDGEVAFFASADELRNANDRSLTSDLKEVIRHKKVWVAAFVDDLRTDALI